MAVTVFKKIAEPDIKEPDGGGNEGVNVGVNVGVNGLLAYIQSHPDQRAGEMAEAFKLTKRTIELSNKKKRPVLALSGKDENDDVRIAFITKTPVDEAQGFALEPADFADEMLKHQSHVRVDKTFNLHISRIEKPVARLSNKGYEHVLRRLVTLDIPNLAALKYCIKPFQSGTSVIPLPAKYSEQAN